MHQLFTRRSIMKSAAAGTAAAAAISAFSPSVYAAATDTLKVGVIGCGGRGSGAGPNCLEGAKKVGANAVIHAVGDVFRPKAEGMGKKFNLPAERIFDGLDAYKKVIDSGVDLVILATPPGFRPVHFKYAVDQGKHVFMEKPVAVDPTGIRMVMAAAEVADQKRLAVVAGTQRRHESNYTDTIKAIHDGAIGEVLHMSVYWNGGGIWWHGRKDGQSDAEYQLSNWYHYVWLCGDQICEQHVHNLDVANWVLNSHPVSAYAMGGRQVRDRLGQIGEIWDHFAVEYEYPNGARVLSFCRHWPVPGGDRVSEMAIGTKGTANPGGWVQVKGDEKKSFKGSGSGYMLEHADLIKSIMDSKPLNEARQVAESTMVAIMGRMAAYTGQVVKWDWAMKESKLDTFPKNLDLKGTLPGPKLPVVGVDKLV